MKPIPVALAITLLIAGLAGCQSDVGYRIASFLFDGVPAPKNAGSPPPAGAAIAAEAAPAADATSSASASGGDGAPAADAATADAAAPGDAIASAWGAVAAGAAASPLPSPAPAAGSAPPADSAAAAPVVMYVHAPYAARQCSACHDPSNSYSLVKEVPDLCLSCHPRKDLSKIHATVTDCLSCHSPHESETRALLVLK